MARSPPALTNGNYIFFITYALTVTPLVTASTPLDSSNNPFPGWNATGRFDDGNQAVFSVFSPPPPPPPTGHTNIAHYAFDNGGESGLELGLDSSTNGNDINATTGWGRACPCIP